MHDHSCCIKIVHTEDIQAKMITDKTTRKDLQERKDLLIDPLNPVQHLDDIRY